jgi:TrmH family RNA methyltransferase
MMPIRVILLEPEKPGNIGAIARSMKNFDLADLYIVNPKTRIDGEARAYAMGGLAILESAQIVSTLEEALYNIDVVAGTSSVVAKSPSNVSRVSITPKQLAERSANAKGTMAIVFGRESSGLSNAELEKCDFMVNIPASRDYNVLNVATAASIVFYELFHKGKTPQYPQLASEQSKQRLLNEFAQIVDECEIQRHRRRLAQRAFRSVISRSFISKREASLLVGVFRKAISRLV